MSIPRWEHGFTLIEILMVVVILAILAGIAGPLLAVSIEGISHQVHQSDLEGSANLALERMSREIRRLRDSESVVTASASEIAFIDVVNQEIRFNLLTGRLTRQVGGGTPYPLADPIASGGLSLAYYDDDGNAIAVPSVGLGTTTDIRRIGIDLTFEKGNEIFRIQGMVRPRNLRHESDKFF